MTAPQSTSEPSQTGQRPPSSLSGLLAAVGPGIVVTGSVIGSGELINTPIQAARFGFVLLWAVMLSCVLKYFLQVEIGRHALVHNRTPFDALNALPGPKWRGTSWIGPIFVAGSVLTAASLVGILRASAGMFHELWPLPVAAGRSVDLWCGIVFAAAFALLWRGTYQRIEMIVTILVGGFSLSVVVGLLLIQGTEYRISPRELFSGLTFSLGEQNRAGAAIAVVSLMGALGATGNELFMYPYWILEKGYGHSLGSKDDPNWVSRARGWIRVLQLDVGICTLLATVTTLGYFLISAAVFFGRPTPAGDDVITKLSAMYTNTFGQWSRSVFLLGALCTLLSTLIVATAAFGRMWCDMFVSLGWLARDNQRAWNRTIRAIQAIYLVTCLAIAILAGREPASFVIFGQYVSGLFGTPLLMLAICAMAFRTDRRVRMGRLGAILLVASVVVFAACVIGSVFLQFTGGR
ncbi:MAG: Nramp family divalent metal transporter [Pirellulales bacterium]|nr:Nramp family divalent metal transporter [Pirellulales bacterium]